MLAVKVDYSTETATVGTQAGQKVAKNELLAALKSIGYSGEFVEQ